MQRKIKLSFILVFFYMLFVADDCPTDTERLIKGTKFTKVCKQRKASVGENVEIKISVTNNSHFFIESYEILKETEEKHFKVFGAKFIKDYNLKGEETREYSYTLIPASPGRKVIKPSQIVARSK